MLMDQDFKLPNFGSMIQNGKGLVKCGVRWVKWQYWNVRILSFMIRFKAGNVKNKMDF